MELDALAEMRRIPPIKEGEIELMDALLELLPRDQIVRVTILAPEPTDAEEHAAWSRLMAEQFFAGYSEADSIYDGSGMKEWKPS